MSKPPSVQSPDAVTLDRIAREVAANVAASIEQFYPGALNDRALFNVKAWTRSEVNRWFRQPDALFGAARGQIRHATECLEPEEGW